DARFVDIDSQILLQRVCTELAKLGWEVSNIDATLIAEKPKIYPRLTEIKAALSKTLNLPISCIGIKATTNEGVDEIGRGLAIAAHAVALIEKA
ncbi:MAG: 2-C-methyl-D-erythritol 2,4-cyclodiphosphate synthase, partial [Opitutaceae bacterium]